jgi:transposase-like protein
VLHVTAFLRPRELSEAAKEAVASLVAGRRISRALHIDQNTVLQTVEAIGRHDKTIREMFRKSGN